MWAFLRLAWDWLVVFWRLSPAQRASVRASVEALAVDTLAADLVAHLKTVASLPARQRAVVGYVGMLLHDPAFPHALHAVATTATTLGLNRVENWDATLKRIDHRWAENEVRHLHAMRLLHKHTVDRRMPNADLNLLTELAYRSYALQPKG